MTRSPDELKVAPHDAGPLALGRRAAPRHARVLSLRLPVFCSDFVLRISDFAPTMGRRIVTNGRSPPCTPQRNCWNDNCTRTPTRGGGSRTEPSPVGSWRVGSRRV